MAAGCHPAEETQLKCGVPEFVKVSELAHSGLLTGLDSPLQAGLNDLTATADNSCPFEGGGRQWWWTFGTLRCAAVVGVGVGAEPPRGLSHQHELIAAWLDVWGVRQRHCTDGVRMGQSLSSTMT
jgi:hypothetical protein